MSRTSSPGAASRDQLRVGHADREQVIEALKAAFVHGRLTKAELDTRAGQALAARTYADLATPQLRDGIPSRSMAVLAQRRYVVRRYPAGCARTRRGR